MKLDYREVGLSQRTFNWSTPSELDYQESMWVHLLELPSSFSYDEALLLCQKSEDEWVAWIPDHGEAVLHTSQFCKAC